MKTYPRDLSWLSFNARVLQEAADPSVPLLERLKFLGIFSSNQDEFFRVRVAAQRRLAILGESLANEKTYKEKNKLLKEIQKVVEKQKLDYDQLFNQLMTELNTKKIFWVNENQLETKQLTLVRNYFKREVLEHLYPIILDKSRSYPYLKDRSIYLAVKMTRSNANSKKFALIEIPTHIPRFFTFKGEDQKVFVMFLDDVIRTSLQLLFQSLHYNQFTAHTLKITRDSELDLLGDLDTNYLEVIKKGLKKRKIGEPVRLIYDKEIDPETFKIVMGGIKLKKSSIIAGQRYHNNKDLIGFPNVGSRNIYYPKERSIPIKWVDKTKSILRAIKDKDILIHHPYHSFDYILRFLRESAIDPKVTEIKITLYRLADNSNVVRSLKNAVKNGKKVTVIMELQARFDEEANIFWARQLKDDGATVIYGFPDKKVHTKLCLIYRKELGKIIKYVHIGTGNYNEQTAKVYSDFSLFTVDSRVTEEADLVIETIKSQQLQDRSFQQLLVSPYNCKDQLIKNIQRETHFAKQQLPASFILKTNSLNDFDIIKAIYNAVAAGVQVNLITRSICSLVHNDSPNLKIISIVDKYLEHARIYYFQNNNDEKIYLGSADLMPRNLSYRFEVMTPVFDTDHKQTLKAFLEMQLKDNQKVRIIDQNQINEYQTDNHKKLRSQIEWRNYLKQNEFKPLS